MTNYFSHSTINYFNILYFQFEEIEVFSIESFNFTMVGQALCGLLLQYKNLSLSYPLLSSSYSLVVIVLSRMAKVCHKPFNSENRPKVSSTDFHHKNKDALVIDNWCIEPSH